MSSEPVKGSRNAAVKCYTFGHKNSRGEPCGANVIKGTRGCKRHAGKPLAQAKAEGAIVEEFNRWRLADHDGSDADPAKTILQLVSYWRWKFDFVSKLLGEAYEAAERLRVAYAADKLVVLAEDETGEVRRVDDKGKVLPERASLQQARLDLDRIFNQGGVSAFVGNTYAATSGGDVYVTGERVRALEDLQGQASDRLAKYCAMALAAGVEERRVRIAEQTGAQLAAVIARIVRAMGGDPADPKVQRLVQLAISQETGVGPAIIEGKAR